MQEDIWGSVLTRIEGKINRHSYYTWFKPTSFVDKNGPVVTIRVPNTLFRDWLNKHYAGIIQESLKSNKIPGDNHPTKEFNLIITKELKKLIF